MHDWTLLSIHCDWEAKTIVMKLLDHHSEIREIKALGVQRFVLCHDEPWGPSVSILEHEGPFDIGDGLLRLVLKVQSGDELEIQAVEFDLPL